jgi:hypothetical protein
MESIRVITREFQVCGVCGELRGPFSWTLQGQTDMHVQQCRCARRPASTWRGFDFNTMAELCYTCGCDVLRSGSRYSIWICRDCAPRVRAVNGRVGRAVVPIARHSIVNGAALSMTPPPTDDAIETFADRLLRMGRRINQLSDWSNEVVRRNLALIRRADVASVPLAKYLDAVRDLDRGATFDAMLEWMAAQPI